jgi:DNA helicase-2/ATP-dependent DNA helicase PcrA
VSALIHAVVKSVGYEAHLQKIGEYESRWENVKELINFADLVAESVVSGADEDEVAQQIRRARDALELDRLDEDEVEAGEEDEDDGMGLSDDEAPAAARVKPEAGRAAFTSGAALKRMAAEPDEADNDVEHVSTREKRARRQAPPVKPEPADVKPRIRAAPQLGASKDSAIELDLTDDDDDEAGSSSGDDSAKALAPSPDGPPSALRTFLQACTLSTDMQNEGQDEGPKVTIATCHAAKGLEFGVVFVVGVEEGNMPFYRSTEPAEIAEERRLLYVACTRAQCMLYLTHAAERFIGGGGRDAAERSLSRFVAPLAERGKHRGGTGPPAGAKASGAGGSKSKAKAASIPWNGSTRPAIDSGICRDLATVLERPLPDGHEEAMVKMKKDL